MKKLFICVMTSLCSTFAFAEGELVVNKVTIPVGGSQTMEVTIGSPTTFTAFQFDMKLPKGVSVTGASVTNPGAKRKVEIPAQVDATTNTWRFLSYDEENALLAEGTKLNVTLAAAATAEAGKAEAGSIVLVTPAGAATEVNVVPSVEISLETPITISGAGQKTFCSSRNLNFKNSELKAYIVTGFDKNSGKIWLTRVYDVPAGTGILLMGDANTYNIPEVAESKTIYKNMLVGTLTDLSINRIDGKNTNYYLSKKDGVVGFYLTKETNQSIPAGSAYLPLPTTIEAVGTAGNKVSIAMNKYGMMSYCSDQSLDFSEEANMKAYIVTGFDKNGIVRLTRVKQVPANIGMVLLAPENNAKNYDISTTSIQQTYANMLQGTLVEKTVTRDETIEGVDYVNYYVSAKKNASDVYEAGFYWCATGGTTISANRAWLPVPKSMTSLAASRGLNVSEDVMPVEFVDDVIYMSVFGSTDVENDGTTTIRSIGEVQTDDVWYNLKGQRIDTPTKKGLYIKNGKKVIVR